MEKVRVMGILVRDRVEDSKKVQEILSDYGCLIKTRIGLHEVSHNSCSKGGLILLELIGSENEWRELEVKLKLTHNIEVKNMDFSL